MVISENSFARITFSSQPEVLSISWKAKPDMEQFKNIYWLALQFVRTQPKIRYYCTDISRSGPFDSEQENWLNREYYPQVYDSIRANIYAAVIFSEGHFKALVSHYVPSQLLPLHDFIQFNYFTELGEALDWLSYIQKSQEITSPATS